MHYHQAYKNIPAMCKFHRLLPSYFFTLRDCFPPPEPFSRLYFLQAVQFFHARFPQQRKFLAFQTSFINIKTISILSILSKSEHQILYTIPV